MRLLVKYKVMIGSVEMNKQILMNSRNVREEIIDFIRSKERGQHGTEPKITIRKIIERG